MIRPTRAARWTHRLALAAAAFGLLAVASGCDKEPAPEPVAPVRVENPDLGLAFASLPAGFEVASNDAEGIRLIGNAPETDGGRVLLSTGEIETSGINLVAESQARIDHFHEIGGTSFGSRELQGPLGTAFTVRGRRVTGEGELEETWVYALHPLENRLVTLLYEYPGAEDSQARINQVLEVLGEVEGLAPAS